jgi:hypothetical protein
MRYDGNDCENKPEQSGWSEARRESTKEIRLCETSPHLKPRRLYQQEPACEVAVLSHARGRLTINGGPLRFPGLPWPLMLAADLPRLTFLWRLATETRLTKRGD